MLGPIRYTQGDRLVLNGFPLSTRDAVPVDHLRGGLDASRLEVSSVTTAAPVRFMGTVLPGSLVGSADHSP